MSKSIIIDKIEAKVNFTLVTPTVIMHCNFDFIILAIMITNNFILIYLETGFIIIILIFNLIYLIDINGVYSNPTIVFIAMVLHPDVYLT